MKHRNHLNFSGKGYFAERVFLFVLCRTGGFFTAMAALFVAASIGVPPSASAQAGEGTGTVVIDSSRFLDNLPYEHEIQSASRGQWLFNNFAVRATTRHNLFRRFAI